MVGLKFLLAYFVYVVVVNAQCPTGFTQMSTNPNKCYLITDPVTYDQALQACINNGAQLMTIENAFENNELNKAVYSSMWIGYLYHATSKTYSWADLWNFQFTRFDECCPYLNTYYELVYLSWDSYWWNCNGWCTDDPDCPPRRMLQNSLISSLGKSNIYSLKDLCTVDDNYKTLQLGALCEYRTQAPISGVAGTDTGRLNQISVPAFRCLVASGYTFFIGQIWEAGGPGVPGTYNKIGIQNIVNASQAGLTDIEATIFPCGGSSCLSAADQVKYAIGNLTAKSGKVNRIWIDIEEGTAWDTSSSGKIRNQNFISDLVSNVSQIYKYPVGIYTNALYWNLIVGEYNGLSSWPLYWTSPNKKTDFSGFKSFGGWTQPTMRQYEFDTMHPQKICGVIVDLDWKEK